MKKAFDQTVRDLKRGVNKKVLKVPSIEQKVLDATSNEPWGPHGSHLADIAMATRNYNEYQMIMAVIWKRISDTGKNWRHVYKALTVLEYLVAHGSERVIDEIKEHAYQISTLSDFQYIDSSGRDQGSNVRKKSQSLVVLVNDKERIQEVRQKAATNRDKYRNTATGGIYRPGSYGDRYDEDRYEGRYGSRDDDHNGYGREREYGYRDDDRYGRYGDSYGRDGERYGRDYDDRYSRHGYRDDDYRGRSQSIDDSQYGSRSRSSDRDRDRAYDDDGQYSSRGSNARADDHLQDGSFAGRRLERKFSEQNLGAPPSYEETVGEGRSPAHSERDGETATAPKSSPPPGASPKLGAAALGSAVATAPAAAPPPASPPPPAPARPPSPPEPPSTTDKEADSFDEFDPRASFSAAPAASNIAEVDLLGSLSDSFAPNPLAIMPVSSASASEAETSTNSVSGPTFVAAAPASTVPHQAFDDPFGDGTFKATLSTEPAEGHGIVSSLPFHSRMNQSFEPQAVAQNADTVSNSEGNFPVASYAQSSASNPSMSPQYSHQDLSTANQETDILADILPPSGLLPPAASQPAFPASTGQLPQTGFAPQTGQPASLMGFPQQVSQPAPQTGFPVQNSQPVPQTDFPPQASQHPSVTGFLNQGSQSMAHTGFPRQSGQPPSLTAFPTQVNQPMSQMGFPNQTGHPASRPGFPAQNILASQMGFPAPSGQATQMTPNFYGGFPPQPGPMGAAGSQMAPQFSSAPAAQHVTGNFIEEPGSAGPAAPQMVSQMPTVSAPQHNSDAFGNLPPQVQQNAPITSQPAVSSSAGPLALVSQPSRDKEKFEPKSAVWADTLSRGLVNLNISGSKTNPLADIGVDFDSINRKEKRMEKPSAAPVTSAVTMGKAMGAGTGIGRAGAGALRGPPNSMVNSGMGAGMGMGGYGGANQPMGMGGYGGVNQPMGMGLGMGMNMAMGQGGQMRPPAGFPPGSNMPGAYNPMMGSHGYGQPPYGGGYQ